ncbi:predicted protein [Arabidopsis lyrata subsp. lyrata]|uniref:Predicted protein n=1 Tax=Arabidopsis lyrata subsp. lyrata TaxID=81972 RepID=D7KKB3_ARALL|nr:predicted protein [Arabidopsis lyrata subsp. lyrata]
MARQSLERGGKDKPSKAAEAGLLIVEQKRHRSGTKGGKIKPNFDQIWLKFLVEETNKSRANGNTKTKP